MKEKTTGKNMVIFSDGTGQKGGVNTNTNVYKLFNMVEDRTQNQITYYDPGLGTNMQKVTGNLFGSGFSKNLRDCYQFIYENFEATDKIYLFGFSRGAATVRSLSAFIHMFGILPRSRPDLIKKAFKIYKGKNREKKAKEFIERHHTMWCKVEFIGVWDTVAALGVPVKQLSLILDRFFPHKFHDFKLSESVINARHALSIDDERQTFHPTLWDTLDADEGDRMKQVWFCGVHTDVGGGYPEHELADITLKWMIREAVDKGLIIYENSPAYRKLEAASFDIEGMMHNEQTGFIGKLFRRKQREWFSNTHGKPSIHNSVPMRTKNNQNSDSPAYAPWITANLKEADYHIEE